jgi:aminoglycoside phosphotransferase (APT) family kinase protein
MWAAERIVDEPLARGLLSQFAELELRSLRVLAAGWDRTVWLVDDAWVFGFPRRQSVVAGIERELTWLPRLAPLLPLPIPNPRFVGEPSDAFPWPFYGSALIPGTEAWQALAGQAERLQAGVDLAHFLRRLHDEQVLAVGSGLPLDANARSEMSQRVPRTRTALAQLEETGLWRAPSTIAALLDAAENLPPSSRLSVCHGDLHVRQLLVSARRASGVIDWIDLCRSDPAVDLSLYWSFLEPEQRPSFLAAYGRADSEQLVRARVLALNLCAILAAYASTEGESALAAECVAGLRRAAAG